MMVYGTALVALLGSLLTWAEPPPANLDFSAGLAGWEGEGFTLLKPPKGREAEGPAVTSQELGNVTKKALLHRAIVIPPGSGVIRFSAFAVRPPQTPSNENLDVVLMASGRRLIPKRIRKENGWEKATGLLTREGGVAPTYIWPVADFVGQSVRIALVDQDTRPGCYVYCTGFEIIPANIFDGDEFSQFMVKLYSEKNLPSMRRYDTPHFIAIGNADEEWSVLRLRDCEMLYNAFYDHFRSRGFPVHEPENKLMVAMFDSQTGFEAYLNRKMSPLITGIYHPQSNRLVTYDYGQNSSFVSGKKKAEQQTQRQSSDLERRNNLETMNRKAQEMRTRANIATIMHETAHQMSFNCGLLDRSADTPIWLGEGLATYCEATKNGSWQGIGELNPERMSALSKWGRDPQQLIPLRSMVSRDDWLRGQKDESRSLLGYAQSWALFRMLMEEQPKGMERYLKIIKPRRNSEARLGDFAEAFGGDLPAMQLRHVEYIKRLLAQESAGKP
jgi:hypothetical protein